MDELPSETPERKKLTRLLIAGGVASLLLPLLGVVYVTLTARNAALAPSGREDLFEHREGAELKITPTQSVAPPRSSTPAPRPIGNRTRSKGSASLDFIKTNGELQTDVPVKPAEAPKPTAAPAPPPAKTKAKAPAKKRPKSFAAPKLQPARGFSALKNGQNTSADEAEIPSMEEVLKTLPK